MLVTGLFSLTTAVALPNVNISPLLITRLITGVLLYIMMLSISALDIQAIGLDVSAYSDLYSNTVECGLIPWAPGKTLDKGIEALNRMFNTVPKGSVYHEYLVKHCAHLLKPLKGYTSVLKSAVTVPNLLKNAATVDLGQWYKRSYTDALKGQSGVYLFFRSQVDKVGSCTNFDSRLSQHYYAAKTDKSPIYAVPVSNYHWTPIYLMKDYKYDFVNTYGEVSDPMEKILNSFTQQQVRSVEQALSFYIKPTFFNGAPINIDHNSWLPGDMKGKHTLEITTASGLVLLFDNMVQAAKAMNMNQSTLRTAHAQKHSTISPRYGKVFIKSTPNVVDLNTIFAPPVKLVANDQFDINSLTTNGVYLLDCNMQLSSHGPFKNVTALKEQLGVSKFVPASRYVNTLKAIMAPTIGESFYLVQNKAA
jgi:hypothetical protein